MSLFAGCSHNSWVWTVPLISVRYQVLSYWLPWVWNPNDAQLLSLVSGLSDAWPFEVLLYIAQIWFNFGWNLIFKVREYLYFYCFALSYTDMQSKYQKTKASLLRWKRRRNVLSCHHLWWGSDHLRCEVKQWASPEQHPVFLITAHASVSYITGSPSHNPHVLDLIL